MSVSPTPTSRTTRRLELWWQFTLRAVELRHRGSHLGFVWALVNPLLQLGLFVVVFGLVFKNRFNVLPNETPVDFALAVFLGLTIFHVVAETMAAAPSFIVSNPNFVKKVVFPLEILPIANVSAYWFHMLISLALLLIGMLLIGHGIPLEGLLWLPVIIAPVLLLSAGLGWALAGFGVFFRDIGQMAGFIGQVIMYSSAVFYSTKIVPASVWAFLRWNPVLHTIEQARNVLLWDQPINLTHVGFTWGFGLASCAGGYAIFKKLQPAFADVV